MTIQELAKIKTVISHLKVALIGSHDKQRNHIDKALEILGSLCVKK